MALCGRLVADDPLPPQARNSVWRKPELAQHFARMFSQTRRPVTHDHGRCKARGRACLAQATGGRMVALEQDTAGEHLRVGDDLVARQHRRARHAFRLEPPQPLLRRARLEHILRQLQAYIDVAVAQGGRSEEHTSELQSPCNLVCRLLLEKKNNLFTLPSLRSHKNQATKWGN